MDDHNGSTATPFDRLRSRFDGSNDSADEDESSEESTWQRYGALLQVFFIVAAAFGGAIVSVASTAIDRAGEFAREGGPALLTALWPVLVGVTVSRPRSVSWSSCSGSGTSNKRASIVV